jgi:hypothetical protein
LWLLGYSIFVEVAAVSIRRQIRHFVVSRPYSFEINWVAQTKGAAFKVGLASAAGRTQHRAYSVMKNTR